MQSWLIVPMTMSILMGASISAHSAENAQLEIKKFRFNQHNELVFERLVLEFASKGGGHHTPSIRLAPSASGKETLISVDRVTLVGAIPESTINDSYSKKSRFFGPVSISTDNPTAGFTIRTFVKTSQAVVDSFWLEKPHRLIVDVYPKSSPRAAGPGILNNFHPQRSVASAVTHGKTGHKTLPKSVDNVLCFMANAQIVADLGFESAQHARGLSMTVDDSTMNYGATDKQVVCYPKKALMQPKVTFSPKYSIPKATLELDQSMHAPTPVAPPAAPSNWETGKDKVSKEEQTNRDADVALGLPNDAELEGRGLSSPSFFSSQDNFNKNNPPPTLGKPLLPPGAKPTLANPAPVGLLPPISH